MSSRFHMPPRPAVRRTIVLALACCGAAVQVCRADGPRRVFGPILTWDRSPATTMTVTWVEGNEISGQGPASSTWQTGQAGFGYGDEDDNTVLGEMKDKYPRVYLRNEFQLDEVRDTEATLHIRYDDGFIAYLNGREIARAGIGKGRGQGARDIENHEADAEYAAFKIGNWRRLARKGRNVLAVEGHNDAISSSDFTLDPYLTIENNQATTALIEKHASWDYLAGCDPPPSWNRRSFRSAESRNARRSSENDQAADLLNHKDAVYHRRVGTNDWLEAIGGHRPFGDTSDVVRTVFIDGLEPRTDYEFTVGEKPSREAGLIRFRTAPDDLRSPFRFVAGGDMSASATAKAMNRLAGKLDPVFAMIGGDIAYANGKDLKAWHDWLDAWRENAVTTDGRIVPLVIGIGNHEMGSELDKHRAQELGVPHDSQFFFSLFRLPQGRTNYRLDFGRFLSLIILDTDHSQPIVGEQTAWLEESLRSISDRQFRIVCYHRPTYGTAKDPNLDVRANWVPLFERYLPTVVFENDHHTLKRTHRIREDKVDPTGVLYLGDGAWGVDTRDVPKPGERWYLANAASANHLWLVTLAEDRADFHALNKNGRMLDQVSSQD